MQTDAINYEDIPPERPVFLKVLCMLTFICSGWLIVTNTVTYFTANDISKIVVSAKEKMYEDINKNKSKNSTVKMFAEKMMNNMFVMYTTENLRKNALGILLGAVFCISGAVLMWKLKRIGYILYVAGTIIGVATPFYVFGNNFIAVGTSGFTAFFGLLFVIFYAMNLSSMR